MMARVCLASVMLVTAFACQNTPPAQCPEPIVIVDTTDAGRHPIDYGSDGGLAEPFDTAGGYTSPDCAAGCTNLRRVGCAEGAARPGEDSCYVVCKRAELTRGKIDFKPRCVAAAKTREAVLACGTYRCL